MIDWSAQHQFAARQLRAAAMVYFISGLVFSATGLVAATLIYAISQSVVLAGAAAAGGMVVGLIVSRRGRKTLLGVPLVVEGQVTALRAETAIAAIDVSAAYVLHPTGERVRMPEREGARSVKVRPAVLSTLKTDRAVCLLCLPNGLAIRALDS